MSSGVELSLRVRVEQASRLFIAPRWSQIESNRLIVLSVFEKTQARCLCYFN